MEKQSFLEFSDCLPEAMLLVTRTGGILAANLVARTLLQLEGDISDHDHSLIDHVQESALELDNYLRSCATSTQPVAGSLTCRSATGRHLCHGRALRPQSPESAILLRCTPTLSGADDIRSLSLRIDTLQQEIARRQQIEARFMSEQAHARAVLNTEVDGIITIDKHGIVQLFNPAAERIFGYPAGEIIGRNVHTLMPSPHREAHDTYLDHYLNTGEKKIIGVGREVQGLRKDGSLFPLELAVSEIKIGVQHHFTGIVRDISLRKLTEEQLRKREEEVRQHRERLAHFDRISTMGEMASGLAHEINQPLTAIASYARACHRLLAAGNTDSSELLETLDKINVQAQRAGDIIHGLRAFVRKRESKRLLYNLNELICDTVVLAEIDAREHNFTVEPVLSVEPLPVVVDPIQIQQVILNLIRNAAEAMAGVAPPGTAVTVVVTAAIDDPGTARVAVIDKGVGIPAEIADKLFDPFFTTKPAGTGIGLAISRTIVTSHGGKLWLEHNPDDMGISMCFTLPLETRTTYKPKPR